MNKKCLDYCLTEAERLAFEKDGYFIVENALDADQVEKLAEITECFDTAFRVEENIAPDERSLVKDFAGKDEACIELVDWYRTFPKVWGILGWNIQLYLSHTVVTPCENAQNGRDKKFMWHQDSDRMNSEIETNPPPRLSFKVGYFLSDCSEPGRGNLYLIPSSHLRKIDLPNDDRSADMDEGVPVLASAGSAVFFDRRIWHSASANYWNQPRSVLFYGYGYRWIQPRDDMTVDKYWDQLDPIRRQLFGASPTGNFGYTSPQEEDVPLRAWIREHLGEEAVIA